jgi:hypothetical protein
VAAPSRNSTLGHSISEDAAPVVVDAAGEASLAEPPVKNDVTRLVNEPSEDAAGGAVAAGVLLLLVVPLSEEHAATVDAAVTTPISGCHIRRQLRDEFSARFSASGGSGSDHAKNPVRAMPALLPVPEPAAQKSESPSARRA